MMAVDKPSRDACDFEHSSARTARPQRSQFKTAEVARQVTARNGSPGHEFSHRLPPPAKNSCTNQRPGPERSTRGIGCGSNGVSSSLDPLRKPSLWTRCSDPNGKQVLAEVSVGFGGRSLLAIGVVRANASCTAPSGGISECSGNQAACILFNGVEISGETVPVLEPRASRSPTEPGYHRHADNPRRSKPAAHGRHRR